MNKTHAVGLIALNDAIGAFGGTWSDSLLAGDIAPKLGCTELNALTQLLRATGHSEVATMWTEAHAKGDEEGDDHYRIQREEDMELWINGNGRITCIDHGGQYLAAAVKARPRAERHETPLDTFESVTPALRAELATTEFPAACESCGGPFPA